MPRPKKNNTDGENKDVSTNDNGDTITSSTEGIIEEKNTANSESKPKRRRKKKQSAEDALNEQAAEVITASDTTQSNEQGATYKDSIEEQVDQQAGMSENEALDGEVLTGAENEDNAEAKSKKSIIDRFESWNPNLKFLDTLSDIFSGAKMQTADGSKHEEEAEEMRSLNKAVSAPLKVGAVISFLFFGVFGLWSVLAPLDSAAIATGVVVLDSNKKTVQHLEGGIIEELLVTEGDSVEEGQVLIRLNETTAEARQALVDGQLIAAKATEARLIAERDNLDTIVFPEKLWKRRLEPTIFDILDGEQRLFETRKKALSGHIEVLKQRIEQLNDEISGLEAQELASRDQLALIQEEVLVVQKLLASGDANRPRLLALQRKSAELEGNRGEYLSLIAKAKQAITETELEIINIQNKQLNEVVAQLRETQTKISDLEERGRASKDILDRILITAPQSGVVTGLRYHTVGGVISPGAAIMDIVPQDDVLVIEARVLPQDIDVVTKGLNARVRLTAFKVRKVPPLDGIVTQVSADKFVDEITGQSYYKAKVKISEEVFASLTDDIELYPGMPADVLIVTGERTFMSYLISPITDSFDKAFKEQ